MVSAPHGFQTIMDSRHIITRLGETMHAKIRGLAALSRFALMLTFLFFSVAAVYSAPAPATPLQAPPLRMRADTPLYGAPNPLRDPLDGLPAGSAVRLLARNGSGQWLHVQTSDQHTGWVCAHAIDLGLAHIRPLLIADHTYYGCNNLDALPDGALTGVPPDWAQAIYVNGITTTPAVHYENLSLIAGALGIDDVMGVYNHTRSFGADMLEGISDVIEADPAELLDLYDAWVNGFDANNRVALRLADVVRDQGRPLIVIGHSQGTALTAIGLQLLALDGFDLSQLTVYTFANVASAGAYPVGPRYYHCVHRGWVPDVVTLLPTYWLFRIGIGNRDDSVLTEVKRSIPSVWGSHSMVEYMVDWGLGDCPRDSASP